jgi:hypothetical protein
VSTCGGRARRYPMHRLEKGRMQVFVVPNRRGAFKLVEIARNGRERTLMRQVGRIVVFSR